MERQQIGHFLTHAVTVIGLGVSLQQCQQARADARKAESEAQTIQDGIRTAPARRTMEAVQKIAEYDDPADRALVLRTIAMLDPDEAVRSWAQKELDLLKPELERMKEEAADAVELVAEASMPNASPSAPPSAGTAPLPSASPSGATPPPTAGSLAESKSAVFDLGVRRLARLNMALEPLKVHACVASTAKGALDPAHTSACQRSVSSEGVPKGADQVHPASGNGMLYWRLKEGTKLTHCECKERS